MIKTPIANFLESTISSINTLTDEREEWEKDKWDVRNLKPYGINYNKSTPAYYLDFNKICNFKFESL